MGKPQYREVLANAPLSAVSELPNQEIVGRVGERREWTSVDKTTGEEREMAALAMEHPEPQSKEANLHPFIDGRAEVWLDGGLRGALSLGKIEPGELVRIRFTGQKPLPGEENKRVNVYEIYRLTPA